MSKAFEKEKAKALRREGESIKNIAKQLFVSRGTVSLWCREIVLTKAQQDRLRLNMIAGGHIGRMKGRDANISKRNSSVLIQGERAKKILGNLARRDIIMLGLGLYWGEGSKKDERRFIFTNSDPTIVRCIMRWLVVMGVPSQDVVGQIYINEQHIDRITKVEDFWINKLKLPKKQMRKSILIKTPQKKYYANRDTYFGTFRLMTKKSSNLQYLTLGLIACVGGQI